MTGQEHLDYDGASVPELLELLSSHGPYERADAACALGDRLRTREIPAFDPPVLEGLASLLQDGTPLVKLEAAIALAEARDRRATSVLLQATATRAFRLDAARALGTLGDPAAIPTLARMMESWLMPWADRLQAAAALCALGEHRGQAYLVRKLTARRGAERAAAMHFLGESRHPAALQMLTDVLAEKTHPLRDVAARTLGVLGDQRALPALKRAQQEAEGPLLEDLNEAIGALERIG